MCIEIIACYVYTNIVMSVSEDAILYWHSDLKF